MKLIIDTNLLFSSISKSDGRIAEIILNPNFHLQLTGCYFSYIELFKYKEKLIKASKLQELEFLEVMYQMLKRIHFFNEGLIPKHVIELAYNLVHDIDEKDTIFVAMGMHFKQKLWSGDKALVDGLRKKGYNELILTNELVEMLTEI
ncbi:MAG: DNA-binding protein [Bacteroidetes bacterium]|nr:DNA-binding protein [Bacteroidota bacterium]